MNDTPATIDELSAQYAEEQADVLPSPEVENLNSTNRRVFTTTKQENQLAQAQAQEEGPGVADAVKRSIETDWATSWAFDGMEEYAPDPNYEMTETEVKELMGDIPEEHWGMLSDAKSRAEAEAIAKKAHRVAENERELSKLGWGGVALRTGVAILDPVAWGVGVAATAATGGVGTAAVAANKLNRLRRVAKMGAVGAGSNVAVEGIIAANNPMYDNMNLLYAGALGAGVGATFGALGRSQAAAPEVSEINRISQQMQRDIEAHATGAADDSAGAARHSRVEEMVDDTNIDKYTNDKANGGENAPRAAMEKFRFDLIGRGKSSKNPLARAAYGRAGEDAVGNADTDIVTEIGMTEKQALFQREYDIRWRRTMEPNFKAWSRQRNKGKLSWFKTAEDRKVFNEEVSAYVRGANRQFAPEVRKAGDEARSILDEYRQRLNQPGAYRGEFKRPVSRDGQLDENPNYLPRVHDMRKFDELVEEFGEAEVRRLVAGAFKTAMGDSVDDVQAANAAQAYEKTLRNLQFGVDGDMARMLHSTDGEELKRVLGDDTSLSATDIEDIVDNLLVKRGDGMSQNMKKRMELDENYSAKLRGMNGQYRTVSFTDLLDNDIDGLIQQYNRRMSGELALAEFEVPGVVNGITRRGEWDSFITKLKQKGADSGQTPYEIRKDVEGLEFLYAVTKGIPPKGTDSAYAQTLKQFRDYNFTRLMGQVGFAQIPEFGIVASTLGFKTMIQSMPGFKTLWRNAQTGKLGTDIANELELMSGIGGDWLRGTVIQRWDEMTGAVDTFQGQSKTMQRIEGLNHRGKRAVFAASGMSTVNTILQRWTLNGIAQKFGNMANGTQTINRKRLRTLGLSDEKQDRIFTQLREHATFDANGKITSMGIGKWDLTDAADFKNALSRYARRVVQENDPGMMQEWMSRPTAQTLLQFKSFILGAYTKNLLHGIHMRDSEAAVSFLSQSFLAGTAYMAQTYLKSIGRDDQDDYLEERLSVQAVGKASFSRAGWASIMPTVMDTGLLMANQDTQFNYMRSSGQATDLFFGNPTGNLAEGAETLLGGSVSALFDGRALSQQELQDGSRLLPFNNVMGITQGISFLLKESGLPKDAPTER